MTVKVLPCGGGDQELPDVTYRETLDGRSYDLRFRYLQRESNVSGTKVIADEWMFYLGLSGRAPFFKTMLKTNRDLLQQIKYHPDCPQGDLILRDTIADNSFLNGGNYNPERVTFSELGKDKRFRLVYFPEE